ncbi:PolC-type DNA polymerase III [Lactobacillus porci]|uniref:DNA polymerase III PolC-type n=1 Tax=Lactobacillus porci TaxID=2012477 RepID=A0A6A8MDH5_9LACO|nr:PolC-type DNA polymerase III [Lactobacillus porci]MST86409.1 PolC-type DNA polymerase III [Lactobacillus porci]
MTEQNELFLKLLKQIKFPASGYEDASVVQAGEIRNVDVYSKERRWDIHVFFATPLKFESYNALNQAIKQEFKDFVSVRLFVETASGASQYLPDYWHYAVDQSEVLNSQPGARSFLSGQKPSLQDGRWVIPVNSQIFDQMIEQRLLDSFSLELRRYGFFNIKLITAVNDVSAQNDLESLAQLAQQHEENMQQAYQAAPPVPKAPSRQSYAGGGRRKGRRNAFGPGSIAENAETTQLKDLSEDQRSAVVEGHVFKAEMTELKSGSFIFTGEMTDYTSSISFKKFVPDSAKEEIDYLKNVKPGVWIRMQGALKEDQYAHDLVFNIYNMELIEHEGRKETYQGEEKHIDLHVHTNMSQLDATADVADLVKTAKKFGQKAIAITDHADLQSLPNAFVAGKKNDLKIIMGLEANMVDDHGLLVLNPASMTYEHREFVIFDVETTGLSSVYDTIIEIGAVKMKDGVVLDRFDKFINPHHELSEQTINLTSITDEMVQAADDEAVVIKQFMDFYGDRPLCGHNVQFDVGFVNAALKRCNLPQITQPVVDTLEVSRLLHPEQSRHTLDSLCRKYNVVLEHHHRANQDAEATGYLMFKLLDDLKEKYHEDDLGKMNDFSNGEGYKRARPTHITILAKNQLPGLRNLYELTSLAGIKYNYKGLRTPKSELIRLHAGLLYGSACSQGEVFIAMMQKGYDEAKRKAEFYDFLEIQPPSNYSSLLDDGLIADEDQLEEILMNIYKLGKEMGKLVVATSDAHYIEKHDGIYRDVLLAAQRGNPNRNKKHPDLHFYTTQEMLDEFSFMGEEIAKEVVITNPNKINDMIDEGVQPVQDESFPPKIPHTAERVRKLTYDKAHELYGDPLPENIQARLDRELDAIIGNGYGVVYLISQMLVAKSVKDGYLVGSRGSVGSSLVATMMGITEINPMPPHYRCPKCKYSEFFEHGEYASGFDLPDKNCPNCDTLMVKDGQNIPFETFLGFHGDKVPDIDLNFSGDYQPVAHNFIRVMFGPDHSFKAGTVGTLADKKAIGYAKHFQDEHPEMKINNAESDRLAIGVTGVKATTGQHPAGIVVLPDDKDIYELTPLQYPSDDISKEWKTTHFDFHQIHDNLLKFDILGHQDPTMIRMLQDLSGIDPLTIPTDDPAVMSLFSSPKALGVTPEQIGSQTGTLGLPEFGTPFVRGMLEETNPSTFAELLQISGLSHGTDVWLGNAEELINNGTCKLKNVIGCRDNIMTDLIHWGVKKEVAFSTMESVRHGRGISDEDMAVLKTNKNIPDWYIPSCLKIKYMFPKAHAAAYILMALRVAWFKVYYPEIYYAAYFSVRADKVDVEAMSHGKNSVMALINRIKEKGTAATKLEKDLQTYMELVNEAIERGINFKMVDINESEATTYKIMDKHTILVPFNAVDGLGDSAAKQIVAARSEAPFLSKEDLQIRGKVSQKIMDFFEVNNVLEGMPDQNQLSLF